MTDQEKQAFEKLQNRVRRLEEEQRQNDLLLMELVSQAKTAKQANMKLQCWMMVLEAALFEKDAIPLVREKADALYLDSLVQFEKDYGSEAAAAAGTDADLEWPAFSPEEDEPPPTEGGKKDGKKTGS